jgi:GNAT superfamily N-acetyltransferase
MSDAAPIAEIAAVQMRDGTPSDLEFIFSTWLRSMWASDPMLRHMARRDFFPAQHRVIERLLSRGATVRVAHLEGAPHVILGYTVTERPGVLHWVYVKQDFRGFGIATRLLDGLAWARYTHWTPDLRRILRPGVLFNPYLL